MAHCNNSYLKKKSKDSFRVVHIEDQISRFNPIVRLFSQKNVVFLSFFLSRFDSFKEISKTEEWVRKEIPLSI